MRLCARAPSAPSSQGGELAWGCVVVGAARLAEAGGHAVLVAGRASESVGAAAKPALAPKAIGYQPRIRSAFPLPLRSWVMHEDLHAF